MMSAIRWYEDAVTGKLERLHVHKALDRPGRESRDGGELPAGLWTLSRHGLDNQVAWSGVPIRLSKAGMLPGGSSDDLWAHAGLPEIRAVAPRLGKGLIRTTLIPTLLQPLRSAAASRSPMAAPGTKSTQQGSVVRQPGQKSAVLAVPMNVSRRATAASPTTLPVAAAKPGSVERAVSIPSAAVSPPPKSSATRSAAFDVALTTPKPGTPYVGKAAVSTGEAFQGAAVRSFEMPASSRTSMLSASSGSRPTGPTDRVLQTAAGKVWPGPGGVSVGTVSAPSPWSAASTGRLASGLPGAVAGDSVLSSLQGRIGDPAHRGSFRDETTGGQNIVPRRVGTSVRSAGRNEARHADQPAGRTTVSEHAGSGGGTIAMAGDRGSSSRGQTAPAATLVSLHGDVMLDGRKMGRMVASGQTSAASLPTVSASAVNLRAVPVFTGTRIPL